MSVRAARTLLGAVGALLLTAAAACADTVVLAGKPPFRNVQVVNFKRGRLYFRGVSKEVLNKPLREVARFEIDRCPALSEAERLAETGAEAAINSYQRALAEATEPWLRTLAEARLIGLYDEAGRFDDAVGLYIQLLEKQPELADECAPGRPGPPGSEVNRHARELLLAAAESGGSQEAVTALQTLALELLLFDEVDPLPPEFAPPASTPASSPAKQSGTEPPLLFGDDKRRARLALRLPAESLVLAGARRALSEADAERAARLIERSLPYVEEDDAGPWRLLMGRCLIELGLYSRAADELLALSESATDRPLAAEALYYVGLANERMERADVAARMYRELLRRDDVPPETQRLAVLGLRRLGE